MPQRKHIRLKFVGFYPRFVPDDNLFYHLLQKHFDLELVEENPDFIFCNHFGDPFELNRYDCPRIFYSGENYSPDFNSVDYALTYDNISYGDRFFQLPYYLVDKGCQRMFLEQEPFPLPSMAQLLAAKDRFCCFLFSHPSPSGMREALREKLDEYKRVDCAGSLYNNMPNGFTIPYTPDAQQKMNFCSAYKFSIAAESVAQPGFITEKLPQAWLAHTIPIYYGAPDVAQWFNPKAFLDARNFPSLNDLLAEVKRLDSDEDAWYKMVSQPLFLEPDYFQRRTAELEAFLVHIFEQEPEQAYRRSRDFTPSEHDARLREYNRFLKSRTYARYLKEKRWNQRRYWAGVWLHKVLPGVFKAPDESLRQ